MTQPDPTPNGGEPMWDKVIEFCAGRLPASLIADMQARDALGRERYGTPLQAHNGRDALQDAYDEALDLCVYSMQYYTETGRGFTIFTAAVANLGEVHREIQWRAKCASPR